MLDMLQPGQLMVHFVLMSNTLLFYVFKLFCWFRYILKHYKIVAKYLFIFTSSQWPLLQCLGDLFDLVTSPGMTEYHSSGCPHVKDMMWHTEHGVATRPLSTFKQLLALTERCIFRGEKETFHGLNQPQLTLWDIDGSWQFSLCLLNKSTPRIAE